MVATIKLLSIKKVSTLKFWGELSLEGGGGGGGGGGDSQPYMEL